MPKSLKRKSESGLVSRKSPRLDEDDSMDGSLVYGDEDVLMGQTADDQGSMDVDGEVSDEEEWGGIEKAAPAVVDTDHHHKPKKTPLGEELRVIKDASDLFKSGSFKLRIDALLPNVRPKASRIPPLEAFLFEIHSFISSLPSSAPQHPLDAARKLLKKNIAVPYSLPLPTEDTNWKVAFEPPSDITLVGSWANKVSVKSKDGLKFGVDLAVEMPDRLFQEKDYLNGRFFQKRAFYLATIAAAISNPKSKLEVDLQYESHQDNARLTKLVLLPRGSQKDLAKLNSKICIIPVLSSSSPISIQRLSPTHSNLRLNVYSDNIPEEQGSSSHTPTPAYNNTLLRAFGPKPQLLLAHALINACPAYSDAITLLRVWANQRGFGEGTRLTTRGSDGLGPWWSSLLALLVLGEEEDARIPFSKRRRSVGKGLSSYQLFKAALQFLAKHDFHKEQVFVKSSNGHQFSREAFESCAESVFIDSAASINLLQGVPLGSLDYLKYEALKTLDTLNQTSVAGDPFTRVFLKDQRDVLTHFDSILRVDLSSATPLVNDIHSILDVGSPTNSLLSSVDAILREGLGDRTKAVTILHPSSSGRPVSQAHPSSPDIIFIGILYNAQNAFRLVDHGPAADEKDETAVKAFRDLWGSKAELRRFKDGRIVESVVWEVATMEERAHIPSMIAKHLLQRHFKLPESAIETCQAPFDIVTRLPSIISQEVITSGVPTGFKNAMAAFDNIVKSIKDLGDELPLSFLNVSPTSPILRYTNVFSPIPVPARLAQVLPSNARYLPVIDFIIEFEKSSRWPDELKAVQVIKLAFFERIASALMSSIDGLQARVVTGDGVHDSNILDKSYLEIVTPDGWAFAAHIWHDRELHLLERVIGGKAVTMPHIVFKVKEKKTKEHYEAMEAKEVFLRRFVHGPRHHRAIATICHHYGAFSGTVRLVKRWLASHWLLQSHISEEAVEILCAYFFIGDGKKLSEGLDTEESIQHIVPNSKERGFALVVQFLKDWKWEEGLLVPLYGKVGLDQATPTPTVADHGTGVWRISTEHDKEGYVWTKNSPDLLVARRVKALADATWKCLESLENGELNVPVIFTHPTNDYDFLIQLDRSTLTRYMHNINADPESFKKKGKYANKNAEDLEVMPGFDPAKLFFEDLQRVYADTFKIFYDCLGGDVFGCVWDPSLRQPRPFRVLGGFSSVPVPKENEKAKDKGQVVLNESAVLAEIERMGEGLITKITVQS